MQTSGIDKSEEHNNGYTCNDQSSSVCVQFLRLDGYKVTDPVLNWKLNGNLANVPGSLDDLLRQNIASRTVIAETDTEVIQPDYSVAALQQLTRNAAMHRSYDRTNAPATCTGIATALKS